MSQPSGPKITFPGGAFTVSGYAPGWSIGNIGQIKLGDYFQITPPSNFTDIQIKAGIHVIDVMWGKRGSLWLDQSLQVGGSYSLSNGNAGGSIQLTNQLMWQPVKELYFNFSFTLSGGIDQNGTHGSFAFGSQFKIIDTTTTMAGVGLHF